MPQRLFCFCEVIFKDLPKIPFKTSIKITSQGCLYMLCGNCSPREVFSTKEPQNILRAFFKAQPLQKRRNKTARGGTIRKHLHSSQKIISKLVPKTFFYVTEMRFIEESNSQTSFFHVIL